MAHRLLEVTHSSGHFMQKDLKGFGHHHGFSERRRDIRLDNLGLIRGYVVSLGAPMTVLEVSGTGCSIQTSFTLPEGAVHDFRFTFEDGAQITVRAEVVYCRREFVDNGTLVFLIGLRFLDDETGLVEKLTALSITFEVD